MVILFPRWVAGGYFGQILTETFINWVFIPFKIESCSGTIILSASRNFYLIVRWLRISWYIYSLPYLKEMWLKAFSVLILLVNDGKCVENWMAGKTRQRIYNPSEYTHSQHSNKKENSISRFQSMFSCRTRIGSIPFLYDPRISNRIYTFHDLNPRLKGCIYPAEKRD